MFHAYQYIFTKIPKINYLCHFMIDQCVKVRIYGGIYIMENDGKTGGFTGNKRKGELRHDISGR